MGPMASEDSEDGLWVAVLVDGRADDDDVFDAVVEVVGTATEPGGPVVLA